MKTQGRKREIIRIQNPSRVTTESGQVTNTFSDFATGVFAEIKTLSGREFFGHEKFNAQVSHLVTVNWREGVTEEMRVIWGTRNLNIEYISEDRTHKREMYLYCMEDKSNG